MFFSWLEWHLVQTSATSIVSCGFIKCIKVHPASSSFSMFAFQMDILKMTRVETWWDSRIEAASIGRTWRLEFRQFFPHLKVCLLKKSIHIFKKSEVQTGTHCGGGPMKTWTSEEDAGPVLRKGFRESILEDFEKFEISKTKSIQNHSKQSEN